VIAERRETDVAELAARWEDNVPGEFYVDRECILCSVCSDVAPSHFRMALSEDHDIVYAQPNDETERAQCHFALVNCPVEAIGDDGLVPGEGGGEKAHSKPV
jgi:ferredoxin